MRRFACMAGVTLALGWTSGARAQSDIFGAEAFHGLVDVRGAASDGERGWLDGGFGKTAQGEGATLRLSEASVEWRPRFSFGLSAVVTGHLQPQIDPAADLGEAFLKLRGGPSAAGRLSGRLGVFYPPVSMEHDGVAWSSPDMLSASALNSWIGEEVKVAGAEASFQRQVGAHELGVTGAVFGWNDTSGTLLSFRGWALHGVKAGVRTRFELPPLSPFMQVRQGAETAPFLELDNRAGWYGRLDWRPPAPVSFNALYYDNAGDRVAVDSDQQWAWETRFVNLGARWVIDERTRLLAQAMTGETLMGYRYGGRIWVDVGYSAAYVLVRREVGENVLSGRVEAFATRDRTLRDLDDNTERGWAATAAWRRPLRPGADLLLEALHVDSDRPARALAGASPQQSQTTVQAALRLGF